MAQGGLIFLWQSNSPVTSRGGKKHRKLPQDGFLAAPNVKLQQAQQPKPFRKKVNSDSRVS
jgi:hypothetical protein